MTLPQYAIPGPASANPNDYVQNSIYKPFAGNVALDTKAQLSNLYMRKITELAMNRFKWEGLPENIDPRFIEYTLYMNALAIFFKHPDYGQFMVWRGSMHGWVDYQDNPVQYLAVGNLMDQSRTLDADKCVPIWSNYMRMPDWDITQYYSGLLSEFEMSIKQTVINSRHPVVLMTDSAGRTRLSLENIYREMNEGQMVIGTYDGGLEKTISESITAVDLGIKTTDIGELQIGKTRAFNECMTFFGIDNANQDKKERLVADEVDANNSQIIQFRNTALNARERACDLINEMFGLTISVEWNEPEPELPDEMPNETTDEEATGNG